MIGGAVWLITGASGFAGRHLARYLLDHAHPEQVRVFSRSESRQAAMQAEMDDPRLRFLLGDVRDADRLVTAFRGVDFLVHAAALKRVDTCEAQPWEATLTNIMGTQHVAAAAIARGIQRAIFLSSDKAPAPDTFYGMTKLCAERLWIQGNVYAAGDPTRFSVTRYGNVMGSTGSVVPVWRQQAKIRGRITITDPEVTRFWMTATQACALIVQAFEQSQGGETFIPCLKAASLGELADVVAPEAEREIVGLRPTEKRHEMLLTEEERSRTVQCDGLMVMRPPTTPWTDRPVWPEGDPVTEPVCSDTVERLTREELERMVAGCR